jgi:ribonuclease BN (tRNA processing enzyme)
MKITFLGTSHGVPAADRYCSSAMLEVGASVYFIDAGAPLIEELLRRGKDINSVRAVFITHVHGDHTNGLLHMAGLMNWYYKQSSMDIYTPEQSLADVFGQWLIANHDTHDTSRLRFHVYDERVRYEDENITVTAFLTEHLHHISAPAHGFVITEKASGRRIVFSGDLSGRIAHGDFPAIALCEPVDALVCEMAHFNMGHVAPYLERCTAKAVYFSHVFPLSNFDDIQAANGKYPFPIYAPNDGDEVEL